MFTFASVLAYIRSVRCLWARIYCETHTQRCRSGVMFFIRDPSDPSHSPVNDIVDRPTGSQLRKVCFVRVDFRYQADTVAGILCCHVPIYCVVSLRRIDRRGVLSTLDPDFTLETGQIVSLCSRLFVVTRLTRSSTITSVPFDILFLLIVTPAALRRFRPTHRVRRLFDKYWYRFSSALHLTSLVQGGSYASDRHPPSILSRIIWSVLDLLVRLLLSRYDPSPTHARVPNRDAIKILPLKDRKPGTFIALDSLGTPPNAAEKLRLLKQDAAARKAGRDPEKDYVMVWLPRWWQARIYVLVFSTLALASLSIGVALFVPLVLGREIMAMVLTEQVHDGYSYVSGRVPEPSHD